jgi:hypothetical protein
VGEEIKIVDGRVGIARENLEKLTKNGTVNAHQLPKVINSKVFFFLFD